MENKKQKLVEVCRSFSYKYFEKQYESRDFFCSQKVEVPEVEAVKASEKLYEFVKDEVMKSVYAYRLEHLPKKPLMTPEESEEINVKAKENRQEVKIPTIEQ